MAFDFIDIKTYLQNKSENIFLKGFWYSIIVSVLVIYKLFVLFGGNFVKVNNKRYILIIGILLVLAGAIIGNYVQQNKDDVKTKLKKFIDRM